MTKPKTNNKAAAIRQRFISNKPRTCIATLTVAEMRDIMQNRNKTNLRPLTNAPVRKYGRDMKAGTWDLGDPIHFDRDGNLINGQHRLKAAIEEGLPLHTVVVYGLDSKTARNMDSHARRPLAVHLGLAARKETGRIECIIARNLAHFILDVPLPRLTVSDIEKVYENSKEEIEWVAGNAKFKFGRAGFLTAVCGNMKAEPDAAKDFYLAVSAEEEPDAASPEGKLRAHLEQAHGKGGGSSVFTADYNATDTAFKEYLAVPKAKVVHMRAACAPARRQAKSLRKAA